MNSPHKRWYVVYRDETKNEDRFYQLPPMLWFLKMPDYLKYLGILKLSESDFPIKYPIYNTHNVRIDHPSGQKPIVNKSTSNKPSKRKKAIKPKQMVAQQRDIYVHLYEILSSQIDPKRSPRMFSKAINARKKVRLNVLERDGNKCLKCGEQNALTMDHVVPESKGGKFTLQNLQTLCVWCNEEKADKTIDYRIN